MEIHTFIRLTSLLLVAANVGANYLPRSELPPLDFKHWAALDQIEHFHMFWTPREKEVTFEIQVKTHGYVGFGFSPNGGMKGADIVLGWVDDSGRVHAHDRHAVGMVTPLIDDSQDVEILGGYENETHTVLRFSRPWDTCDKEHDFQITGDTMRVIWSYSDEDPITEYVMKKHTHRGTKSIFLQEPRTTNFDLGDDVYSWEIQMTNVKLPDDHHTLYWCQMFKVPPLNRKTHVVGVQPIIEEKNRAYVHHMLLYECRLDDSEKHYEKWLQVGGLQCSTPNMPVSWKRCNTPLVGWAVGGEGEVFPEHVGLPIGEDHGGSTYFMMEMHYDNPNYHHGIVDNSGLRVFLTEQLRQYDAGMLVVGHLVTPAHIIPPSQKWKTITHCPSDCLSQRIPEEGIKVFKGNLHAHLLGHTITARQIRNGRELPIIFKDMNYDFNYQQARNLKEEMTILPGDSFITECGFDSTKKDKPTFGGESTQEEMCLAFFTYYPRVNLTACFSTPEFHHIFQSLGIEELYDDALSKNKNMRSRERGQIDSEHEHRMVKEMKERERNYEETEVMDLDTGKHYKNFVVKAPAEMRNTSVYDLLHDPATWQNEQVVARLQEQIAFGPQQVYCVSPDNGVLDGFPRSYQYPDFMSIHNLDQCDIPHEAETYVPESSKGQGGVSAKMPEKSNGANGIFLLTPLILLSLALIRVFY